MSSTSSEKPGHTTKPSRAVHTFFGFKKRYNFLLFLIFAGALMGFTLARLQFFNYNGIFCGRGASGAAPGECYYYTRDHYKVGMVLHIFCILPAGFLACFQFVPAIRHKEILLHRINGYVIVVLVVIATAGALMVARVAFGGGLDVQGAVGLLSIMTLGALATSIFNIKRLRIDQHRAWMLRVWFYLGAIITARIILITATLIISNVGDYYTAKPCGQLEYIYDGKGPIIELYPECASYFDGTNPNQHVVVNAKFGGRPEQIATGLGMSFGMALWLSIAIHAIGIEFYINLTPTESERLRKVSQEKRLEAGIEKPNRRQGPIVALE